MLKIGIFGAAAITYWFIGIVVLKALYGNSRASFDFRDGDDAVVLLFSVLVWPVILLLVCTVKLYNVILSWDS